MKIQAGAVLDPYDDGFASLSGFFRGRKAPEFIKTASIMSGRELDSLPDHAFAVVFVDDHRQMRKYACTDKAHTAVNVMYFLQHQDEVPPTARVKTASNLVRACQHFGIQPPVALVKTAVSRKRLIKSDGAEVVVPVRPAERLEKESDLSGTSIMPNSARPQQGALKKEGSVMESPYVRLVDEWDPSSRRGGMTKHAAFGDGRVPLNTYDDVDGAVTFFEEMAGEMHPRVRHEMCVKLASRADDLGVPVSGVIRKYGSTGYASSGEMAATLQTRRQVWASLENEEGPGLLDLLMEKRASLHPERFAEALAEIDASTQIDHYWDQGVADPWLTTFGVRKTAAWSWARGDVTLNESQLKKLATEKNDLVKEKFGEELASGLASQPTVVFDSLPMDTQRIIASMARR